MLVLLVSDCSAMTTARYRPTWDLALDPLVSCKLCLGEYPAEQMTTIAQCQCIFCTLVGLPAHVQPIALTSRHSKPHLGLDFVGV